MGHPDELRISSGTWSYKHVYPIFMVLFVILWSSLVVFSIWTHLSLWVGGVALLCAPGFVVACVYREVQQAALLKDVYLGDRSIRVADSTTEVTIPLAAIEAITRAKINNMRNRATVILREPTDFGDRFTFMPKGARRVPNFTAVSDDAIVVELRRRVAAARGDIIKPIQPSSSAARSVMADDELDGPF